MFVWLVGSMSIDVVARLEHADRPPPVMGKRGLHRGLPRLLD